MDNTEFTRNIPPLAVTTGSVLGISFSDWVYIATFVYIIVQIICVIYRTFRKQKE